MSRLTKKIDTLKYVPNTERLVAVEEIIYKLGKLEDLEENNIIITTPKSIKLSELIQKIYDTKYKSECYVHPIRESFSTLRIRVEYGDGYWGDYEFYIINGKISSSYDMDLPRDEFKWLYILWIAGTQIIDDLEVYKDDK